MRIATSIALMLMRIAGPTALILGITQSSLLPGPFHWIIQVIHLAVGIIAMILGSRLAKMIERVEKVSAEKISVEKVEAAV